MTFDIALLQSSLAAFSTDKLYSEDVVKQIQDRLRNSPLAAKLADTRAQDANQLATDTVSLCKSFDEAKGQLDQLQDRREPWVSKWQSLRQSYVAATKKALAVEKNGISFFEGYDSKIGSKLDWAEEHFEEAKALVAEFVKNPIGAQLEPDSSAVSQLYTDNRRTVSEYKTDFSGFVDDLSAQNQRARDQYNSDIDRLNAEIARDQSAVNQILTILEQIAGIPSWMWWLISEILEGLGFGSAEEARRELDRLYGEQQRLKEDRDAVQTSLAKVNELSAALSRAQATLSVLTTDVADIDTRLDSFATQWAQFHHDIVLIGSDMQTASDSATKRALISRLKLLGESVDALLSSMKIYVQVVGGSGLFN